MQGLFDNKSHREQEHGGGPSGEGSRGGGKREELFLRIRVGVKKRFKRMTVNMGGKRCRGGNSPSSAHRKTKKNLP